MTREELYRLHALLCQLTEVERLIGSWQQILDGPEISFGSIRDRIGYDDYDGDDEEEVRIAVSIKVRQVGFGEDLKLPAEIEFPNEQSARGAIHLLINELTAQAEALRAELRRSGLEMGDPPGE